MRRTVSTTKFVRLDTSALSKHFHPSLIKACNATFKFTHACALQCHGCDIKVEYSTPMEAVGTEFHKTLRYIDMATELLSSRKSLSRVIVHLILLPLEHTKQFPKDPSLLSSYNMNSGLTTRRTGNPLRTVHVYRREEMLKVIMHELVHSYGLDLSNLTMPRPHMIGLHNMFGLSFRDVDLNEAYTEACACYYNAMIFHSLNKSRKATSRGFDVLLRKELMFGMHQAGNVIAFLGYTKSPSHVYPDDSHPAMHTGNVVTHILCYHVMKAALMFDGQRPDKLPFKDALLPKLTNPEFWKVIWHKHGKTINPKPRLNSNSFTSLAMTCLDCMALL
jgi:hypothetical protein